MANYEQNKYIVSFWSMGDAPITTILRQAGEGTSLPLTQMQEEGRAMLPLDAKLVKTVRQTVTGGAPDDIIEIYQSASLATRYLTDPKIGDYPWFGGGPGSVTLNYQGGGIGWEMGAGNSGQSATPTLGPASKAPTTPPDAGTPGVSRYLDDVIKFTPNPKMTVNGEDVSVVVQVTNQDNVAHTFNAQANFYRVALKDLGDDPAQYLVTAGFTSLTLGAGEKQLIQIKAKTFLPDPIVSVDFSVVGK